MWYWFMPSGLYGLWWAKAEIRDSQLSGQEIHSHQLYLVYLMALNSPCICKEWICPSYLACQVNFMTMAEDYLIRYILSMAILLLLWRYLAKGSRTDTVLQKRKHEAFITILMLFTLKDDKTTCSFYDIYYRHSTWQWIWEHTYNLAIYTCVLCTDTDDMITFMPTCMLLGIHSILPFWLIVCAYMLCLCYKCIWIFMCTDACFIMQNIYIKTSPFV